MQDKQKKHHQKNGLHKWVVISGLLAVSILPAQGMWTAAAYLFNGVVAAGTKTTEAVQTYLTVPKTPENTFNMHVANDQKKEAFEIVKQQLMELADSQSAENEKTRLGWIHRYLVADSAFMEYENFKKEYEAIEQKIENHYISEKLKKEKEKCLDTITKCHRIIYFGLQKLHVYEGQGGFIDRSISSKTRRRTRVKNLECSTLTEKSTQWATFNIELYKLLGSTEFSQEFNNFLDFFQETRSFFQKTHPDIIKMYGAEIDLKEHVYDSLGLNLDGSIKTCKQEGHQRRTKKRVPIADRTPPLPPVPASPTIVADLLGLDLPAKGSIQPTRPAEVKQEEPIQSDEEASEEEYTQEEASETLSDTGD